MLFHYVRGLHTAEGVYASGTGPLGPGKMASSLSNTSWVSETSSARKALLSCAIVSLYRLCKAREYLFHTDSNLSGPYGRERLGHSDIRMTLGTYSHVLPSIQEDATDKLDDEFGGL
jgi:hypothetical protein